jgi:ABC-2 type transport system permease protein
MNQYVWLIRREFWENRAIWIVPAVIGGALTLGALFGKLETGGLFTQTQAHAVGGVMLFAFGVTFFVVMNLYATWYLVDCLYSDRKDRSILFWKSLPISDTATVLSKLVTGVIVIPLVYFVAADVSTLLIAFIISVRARSAFGGALWQPDVWLQLQVLWLYLIVTTAIWYLPFIGYLLAISAWAKRAVMLWTILPPLALYLVERWFFGTHVVGTLLWDRTYDYAARAFSEPSGRGAWVTTVIHADSFTTPGSVWTLLDPVDFVTSPATWIGVVVGIAFIIIAIQLRLRRTET